MELQQNHYVGAVLTQVELLNGITERLDEWSDLIVAGNGDALLQLLDSNDLNKVIDCAQTSRSAFKMLQQNEPDSEDKRFAKKELTSAYQKLVYSNTKLQILVNRGTLFTRTMLNAIAGETAETNAYDGFGNSSRSESSCLRGEA